MQDIAGTTVKILKYKSTVEKQIAIINILYCISAT